MRYFVHWKIRPWKGETDFMPFRVFVLDDAGKIVGGAPAKAPLLVFENDFDIAQRHSKTRPETNRLEEVDVAAADVYTNEINLQAQRRIERPHLPEGDYFLLFSGTVDDWIESEHPNTVSAYGRILEVLPDDERRVVILGVKPSDEKLDAVIRDGPRQIEHAQELRPGGLYVMDAALQLETEVIQIRALRSSGLPGWTHLPYPELDQPEDPGFSRHRR